MSTLKVDDIQSRQSTDDAISLASDSSVSLKHSASAKLTTTSSGVSVTGTCTATTFSGSGASLTSLPSANLTGALPAIDGSNLTGVGGGGLEFIKEISPSSAVSSITETGLDYDKVYRLVVKKLRVDGNVSDLRFHPHLDNSSTEFVWGQSPYAYNGECRYHYISDSGVTYSSSYDSYWRFQTGGYSAEYYGGYMDFGTTTHPWLIGSLRGIGTDRSFSQLFAKKKRENNTNQDSNQTDTYAKMNGFTLKLHNGSYFSNFHQDTLFYLYKAKES